MRHFSFPVLVLALLLLFAGCGGGRAKSTVGAVATVTLAPNPTVSLNAGDVLPVQVVAVDANKNVVLNQTFTYSSSNSSQIQIAINGLLCGGTWDSLTNPVICTPPTSLGTTGAGVTSTITSTAQGITSNAVAVDVHQKVTSVVVTPASTACVSQNATIQYTAQAFSGSTALTNIAGFNWTVADPTVGTLTSATTSGAAANTNTATAKLPGTTTVIASVNSANPVNSVPVSFNECPVASIAVAPAPVNLAAASPGNTQQLTATATDMLGVAVSVLPTVGGITLTYNTNSAAVATVNATGLVTAAAPGTATITASCSPNTCNKNLNQPIFSNVAVTTVAGTTPSPTVYVASKTSNSLIPITNNTAGTAITLPQKPTSMIFNNAGTMAYLGSSAGLMVLTASSNTVAIPPSAAGVTGNVLAVSPNGQFVIISSATGSTAGQVFLFDQTANSVAAFPAITSATAADFSPDSTKAYIVSGSTLFVVQQAAPLHTIKLTNPASDVSVLSNGTLAYLAAINTPVFTTCNDADHTPAGTRPAPTLVKTLPDGSQMLGVDPANMNIDAFAITITATQCPATFTEALTAHALGTSFTPNQIIVTPDSKHAYIPSSATGQLLGYNVVTASAAPIALSNTSATTTTGGATPDSATVYVGASDNNVHIINVANGTETQPPIAVSITPDLVAVRP